MQFDRALTDFDDQRMSPERVDGHFQRLHQSLGLRRCDVDSKNTILRHLERHPKADFESSPSRVRSLPRGIFLNRSIWIVSHVDDEHQRNLNDTNVRLAVSENR